MLSHVQWSLLEGAISTIEWARLEQRQGFVGTVTYCTSARCQSRALAGERGASERVLRRNALKTRGPEEKARRQEAQISASLGSNKEGAGQNLGQIYIATEAQLNSNVESEGSHSATQAAN